MAPLPLPTGLTPAQVGFFKENGYLVIPDYLTPTEVDSLLTETNTLLDEFPLDTHPLTTFTTGDDEHDKNSKHIGDEYFLTSNDKVRFFFEPDAVSTTAEGGGGRGKGTLLRPKNLAVNKIGHSLHTLSAPFRKVSLSDSNAAIARSLGFQDPRVLQSMVICKQPGIGGAVNPHRDSEFLYTSPPSAVGWWFALQDASVGNATLGMWKGSHVSSAGGGIRRRLVRADEGGTKFIVNEGPKYPKGDDGSDVEAKPVGEGDGDDFEILDVKAGSLVLIHGNVLHSSEKNTSPKSRFAYTFHVIEGDKEWEYDERNWLHPPENGFSKLYQS